jgi:aminoglycoside phosphotransferase (APT) family kinase protein
VTGAPHAEIEPIARRCIPGRGAVRLQRVGTGLGSRTYRAERAGHAYALRLAPAAERGEGFDPRWEHAVRAVAGGAGLAPEVVHSDPVAGILVSRWVDGRSWDAVAVDDPGRIAAVAGLMRAIHALTPPQPARRVGVADWIAHYERALGGPATLVDAGDALRAAARRRLAVLARVDEGTSALCHSDLHALNLVETASGLVALDWEYAHVGDPFWDVVGWSCANDWTAATRAALLERYLGRAPSAREAARFAVVGWLYDYVGVLWSELFLRRAGDADAAEVRARARRMIERLESAHEAALVAEDRPFEAKY